MEQPMSSTTNTNNILYTPQFPSYQQQPQSQPHSQHAQSFINQSSLIEYANIVCCICSAPIPANPRGICDACEKKSIDISSGISNQSTIYYCKNCQRYMRPPWIKCELESTDMMNLCLSKIKGLNKAQIVDSAFVWTEPHSKLIKVKITIQKFLDKQLATASLILEYKVEWTQCDDCKKTFTPHLWNASVQVRQKVNHKMTFLYLEQLILKHKAHTKTLNIKEHNEGIDFYFSSKSHAQTFMSFVNSVMPIKTKQSRQLISHDQKSNVFNYKYSFMLEIAPICRNDLIVLSNETSKAFGGIGPFVLCYKQTNHIHLIDPITFDILDIDGTTYWQHQFKSVVNRECLSEFYVMNCNEEVDYDRKYEKERGMKSAQRKMDVDVDVDNSSNNATINISNVNVSDQYERRKRHNLEKNRFVVVTAQVVKNGYTDVIEVRTHLGRKMHPGDVYYGYDLREINVSGELLNGVGKEKVPDVVLVKKKYHVGERKIFKLKRMKMDVEGDDDDEDGKEKERGRKGKKRQQKVNDRKEKEFERFVEDVAVTKDIRSKINLYVNKEEVDKLGKDLEKMGLCKDGEEDGNDSDTEIKMTELIDKLNIDDDSDDDGNNNGDDDEDYTCEFGSAKAHNNTNNVEGDGNKKVKIGEKRERNGEHINDE